MNSNREIKDALFEQVARIGKAVSSPKRLELIELLCQAAKPVELLAREAGISVKLASAHLKELRHANLVATERSGKQIIYRIAAPDVAQFWNLMRALAEDRLFELQDALRQLARSAEQWQFEDRDDFLRKARNGEIVVIDVRPRSEYDASHIPFARSMPMDELRARLAELPKDVPVLAYCRGPYCMMSVDAVGLLKEQGFAAYRLPDSVTSF